MTLDEWASKKVCKNPNGMFLHWNEIVTAVNVT